MNTLNLQDGLIAIPVFTFVSGVQSLLYLFRFPSESNSNSSSGSDAEVDSLEFRSPSLLRSRLFQLWCRGSSALSEMAKRGYKLRILFWFWWKGFGWELDMCFANFEQILGFFFFFFFLCLSSSAVSETEKLFVCGSDCDSFGAAFH